MPDDAPSFTRGLFAGAIHDALLFPYPEPLDARDPDEARTVRRLIDGLHQLEHDRVIDAERYDAEERVSAEAIRAFAERGMLGHTIPKEFGGLGLSHTAYARVFGTRSSIGAGLSVLVGVHCGLGSK